MVSLLLAVLVLFTVRRQSRRRARSSDGPVRVASPRPSTRTETLADLAFDYSRAVLELNHVGEATKDRALRVLEREILPLAGKVPLDEVTPQFEAGIRAVLLDELEGGTRTAEVVWQDLLRWSRVRLAATQYRTR